MFHIREDNSLLEIIRFHNEKWNEQIDFQIDETYFQKNIEIFTDVDKVLQAYDDIIRLIILFNKNLKPRVRLSLKESQVATSLSIHHLDRTYAKSLETCKNRLIGQNYSSIIKNLNGICNIYLTADFGSNQFAAFAIWDEKWNIQKERDVIEALDVSTLVLLQDFCDNIVEQGVIEFLEVIEKLSSDFLTTADISSCFFTAFSVFCIMSLILSAYFDADWV